MEPFIIPDDWFNITDFDPIQPGGEAFGYLNFAYGLLTGGFGPYVQRNNYYDCMGEYYAIANDSIELSLFFMGVMDDPLGFIPLCVRGALIIYNIFRGSLTCYSEYMYGLGNPYRELYGGIKLKQSMAAETTTQSYTPIDSLLNSLKV